MAKYIEAEQLKAFMYTGLTGNDLYAPNGINEFVDGLPVADVVSRGVLEQVMWERDLAISQLAEIGKGLGEKMDDVQGVRHGKWIMHIDDLFPAESTMECDQCHEEQPLECDDKYCPACGAKMEGIDE